MGYIDDYILTVSVVNSVRRSEFLKNGSKKNANQEQSSLFDDRIVAELQHLPYRFRKLQDSMAYFEENITLRNLPKIPTCT